MDDDRLILSVIDGDVYINQAKIISKKAKKQMAIFNILLEQYKKDYFSEKTRPINTMGFYKNNPFNVEKIEDLENFIWSLIGCIRANLKSKNIENIILRNEKGYFLSSKLVILKGLENDQKFLHLK